ncbi:autotransporter outer membrane beta-barrel domain-containing protein [Pseudomonas sp. D1-1]|uniref:autotransporter outer membrane beta-barrel domain-containing protein n=1 Tax=Pseudomonas sp. D1-1 TaxID=1040793 RepID=UPI003DA8959E
MSTARSFKLHPLSRTLKLLSCAPLWLFSDVALAARVLVPGEVLTIDNSTPADNYVLNGASTLNVNGAQTRDILVNESTLNLTGAAVQATDESGVHVVAGTASIAQSNISSSDRTGLALSSDTAATKGASVTVSDSLISGAIAGASVNALTTLTVLRSTLSGSGTGTGSSGDGLRIFNGSVTAVDSRISGSSEGILFAGDARLDVPGTLELNNTHVEGLNGSAILVDTLGVGPVQADIAVLNGSTLTASNGILMDVRRGAEGNLRVGNSNTKLVGDIRADDTSTANVTLEQGASLTGRLINVDALAVNSGATWAMVEDGVVDSLTLDGGNVQLGSPTEFYKLSVGNLSGTGNFIMDVDFATGQVDTLEVTGTATGRHTILMGSSGQDPLAPGSIPVVHIADGDAQFSLLDGAVDLGTYSYDLVKHGDNDWYLDTTSRVFSPGTRSVLALFNTAPTVWYGELSTLRSRMGEVRMNPDKAGGWMRSYGNKFDVSASSGLAYQQVQQGVSFGADAPLPFGDGQWLVGLLGGYSQSDLDLSRGTSGTVNSYYLGAYTTWLDQQSGYYLDAVIKFNRFQNKSDVQLSDGKKAKGDYNNHGVGASLEVGRHIKLADDYFIEPFTQLSGVVIQGKDYDLNNDLAAEGSRTRSILGKAGATAGRTFRLAEGKTVQPYLRAAYVHEFAKNNEVEVNNNVFNNDLSGSRGELGVGVAMTLTDKVAIHADFDYSNGDKIDQPWGANIGVRYLW